MTVLELLLGVVIVALLLATVFKVLRAVTRGGRSQASLTAFLLTTGNVFESLRQDLRSARKVQIAPDGLVILRCTGLGSDGRLLDEEVDWSATVDALVERRGESQHRHPLSGPPTAKGCRVTLAVQATARREQEGRQLATLQMTVALRGPDGQELPGFVASAAVNLAVPQLLTASGSESEAAPGSGRGSAGGSSGTGPGPGGR